MEDLMYLVWQQRLFRSIHTLDGLPLEVIHPGLRNRELGPDFFNAKVRYDGIIWAGNVEMHVRASDWYRHHHDDNQLYDSVILHVVLEADAQIHLHDGTELRTVVMQIPDDVMRRYHQLCGDPNDPDTLPLLPGQIPTPGAPSCQPRLAQVPSLTLHDWFTALCTSRMLEKMQRVQQVVERDMKSWEEGFYTILLRSLGTGTNGDAMERLAHSLPYAHLLHHRDNLLQLRAMLLGQAGLIVPDSADGKALQQEYNFLRNKFSLTPLSPTVWKMSRQRPQAAPHCRLNALAQLLHQPADGGNSTRGSLLSQVLEARDIEALSRLFTIRGIGAQTVRSIIINAVVPTLLSYYKWQGDEERCEQALTLLEQLPAEQNHYVAQWTAAGIDLRSAFDTQAVIQLTTHYCQPHKCLQCRIGCWLIKKQE